MGQPIGNQWRPRGPSSGIGNSNKPECQICGLKNHVASDCYHWMNLSYKPPQPKAYNTVMHPSGDIGNFSGGNQVFQQPTVPALSGQIASADTVGSSSWYMDSRATYHFTHDITMIQYPSAYQGNE